MTFTIDTDNNIAAHAGTPASAENIQSFASQQELAKLAAGWPAARLVETWNSFAGVAPFDGLRPVKKFTNRKVAVWASWFRCSNMPGFANHALDKNRLTLSAG